MHPFDSDLTLIETAPYTLKGEISDGWSHIGTVNGGFQLAVLYKAMERYARQPEGLIITGNYLARCVPGPVEIRVEPVSSTRNFDRLQARLFQEGSEKLRAFGTFTGKGGAAVELGPADPEEPIAPVDACIRVDGSGRTRLFDSIDVLLDPACAGWMRGDTGGDAMQKGWIRFREPRMFDIPAIIMAADSFPPSIFSRAGYQGMVPTIEYTVQTGPAPSADTLGCLFRSRHLTGEIITEEGVLRDPEGGLVAVSRQAALFRNN